MSRRHMFLGVIAAGSLLMGATGAAAQSPAASMAAPMSSPFGAACSALPTDGPGSVAVMAAQPLATAASGNALLSTLVAAVTAAGLGDTLNTTQDITVFAPTNDAFTALDPATLAAAMADPKGLLTTVLTYHVVAGRIAPDALVGPHTTLQGGDLTVAQAADGTYTVNDTSHIICGDVQTANATVYIIDGVLLPPAAPASPGAMASPAASMAP
jgi:uncharacterized surface protein with fasciclin (FAS1) repeats